MNKRKEMHNLLGKMIDRAEAGDLKELEVLKKAYHDIAKGVYSDPWSALDFLYNRCAADLLKSLEFPGLRHLFTESSRQIYSKLPVPRDDE